MYGRLALYQLRQISRPALVVWSAKQSDSSVAGQEEVKRGEEGDLRVTGSGGHGEPTGKGFWETLHSTLPIRVQLLWGVFLLEAVAPRLVVWLLLGWQRAQGK